MSIRAMLLAIPVHLREELSLADDECDVQPEARPPAQMGERYIAVCEAGVSGSGSTGQGASTLRKIYNFRISITRRTGQYGRDRTKNLYVEAVDSIDQLATAVVAKIHGSYPLITIANGEISGGAPGFQLPLWFVSQDPAFLAPADWAGPTADNDSSTYIATVLHFSGALRIQTIGLAQ